MSTTTGYIAEENFRQIKADHYQYTSAAPERAGKIYDIHYINGRWQCSCPDARGKRAAGYGERCKHERGLIQRIAEIKARSSRTERQAEEIVERAEESAEIAMLRAEVEALRARLDSQQPADIAAIIQEVVALRAENVEIKKQLATKATARRKHQLETESAQIKEQINSSLDDAMQQAENAISAVKMVRAQVADLESIPHALKEELDAWTAAGKEELQPSYQPEEANAPEIRAAVREAQESERTRRQKSEREQREKAPLNGNSGFLFNR